MMITGQMRRIIAEGRAEELVQILADDIRRFNDRPNRLTSISYYARLMHHCFRRLSPSPEYADRLLALIEGYFEMEDENSITITIPLNSAHLSGDPYFSDAKQARLQELKGRRETLTPEEYTELEILEYILEIAHGFAKGIKSPSADF